MNVGDKVYLKAVGNNARGRKEVFIKEYEIIKIGRKYLEVGDDVKFKGVKFNLETLKQENGGYTPDWELYFSKQEILDKEEHEKLSWDIRKAFDTFGKVDLTLDQLRRIKAIISE